jgi:hypothetical protein
MILAIFDEVMASIPLDFPLDEEIVGGVELLSSFRERREMAGEELLFSQDQRYVSFNNPSPLGEFWGRRKPLEEYWRKP